MNGPTYDLDKHILALVVLRRVTFQFGFIVNVIPAEVVPSVVDVTEKPLHPGEHSLLPLCRYELGNVQAYYILGAARV